MACERFGGSPNMHAQDPNAERASPVRQCSSSSWCSASEWAAPPRPSLYNSTYGATAAFSVSTMASARGQLAAS